MDYLLDKSKTWLQLENELGFDRRITKGISKAGHVYPTLVQAESIPLINAGKNVLVRAKTGSGKTIAFAAPIVQKIISLKNSKPSDKSVKCIVLVPKNDLIRQISGVIKNILCFYLED